MGSRNDCAYHAASDKPDPEMPYGYVEPMTGGWEVSIWHPKDQQWCGVQGMPFKTRTEARRVVKAICDRLWVDPSSIVPRVTA